MKKANFYPLVLLLILSSANSFTYDLNQTDKHGNTLKTAPCNKDTIIDFSFSSDSVISNCSTSGCSITNPTASTMNFLDVAGQQKTYTLQSATPALTPGGVSRSAQTGIFLFAYQNADQYVFVGIPFSNSISSSKAPQTYELNLTNNSDPALNTLSTTTNQINNSTGLPLSAFNFLNGKDYGIFYHVADSASSTTATYLLSYFILSNMKISTANLPNLPFTFPSSPVNYLTTGDKLCYGSVSQGLFQTHIRQSYPLWTAWIGILFYWLYYMLTQVNQIKCYDRRFQNNKWTCWGIFSLHHLGNQEYFTKLSRQTLMLISFSWQALICAIFYSKTPYGQNPIMILWVGAIAMATALPFSYVLGYFFLTKIYQRNLNKFDIMHKMHGHFNKKDGIQKYDAQLDDIQQSLYGLYYWYYVIAFVFFVVFWALSVHQMMQLPFQFYYLHRYWLASLGVAFGLEYLVVDPLMTLIFGNFRFYQIRGFYYQYQLGQKFKQLEQ